MIERIILIPPDPLPCRQYTLSTYQAVSVAIGELMRLMSTNVTEVVAELDDDEWLEMMDGVLHFCQRLSEHDGVTVRRTPIPDTTATDQHLAWSITLLQSQL